jgi:hypothetical protein
VTQQHFLLPVIPCHTLVRLYTTTIIEGFKLYFAGSYFQLVTTRLAKQLLRQSDCRVAAWWRVCSARHLSTVLPMFQRWMEHTHCTCHDQDACHAAAHYSAFMVARCSHLFRFVPLDSLLDKCMARASDHSALSTLAALQLSPETQV